MRGKVNLLYEELEPLLGEMGYVLLEAKSVHVQGRVKVYVTVFSGQGIAVDDCIRVNKTLLPRLKIMLASQDIVLEVSSPGLERKIARFEEFIVFKGKSAKILIENEDWIWGDIVDANEKTLILNVSGNMRELTREQVIRAQLVYKGDK